MAQEPYVSRAFNITSQPMTIPSFARADEIMGMILCAVSLAG